MKTKVLVVPVYRKHWLWFTYSEISAAEAAAERALVPWMQGASLQEKATLLGKEIGNKMNTASQKQWRALQAADEGTFRNRLFRLAEWVLSQEDPTETFLKSLPTQPDAVEIIHPSTLKERLVRRRMRRMALAQEHYHNRRILGWALATLPQMPLMITPFPNVTLYYTAYKMVSHYQARQGCRTLRAAFERYDAAERERAAAQGGRSGRPLRFLTLPWLRGGGGGGAQQHTGSGGSTRGDGSPAAVPHFRASRELDKAVQPLDRWQSPLTDEQALRVRDMFKPQPPRRQKQSLPNAADQGSSASSGSEPLPELVARLRRKVLGAD